MANGIKRWDLIVFRYRLIVSMHYLWERLIAQVKIGHAHLTAPEDLVEILVEESQML